MLQASNIESIRSLGDEYRCFQKHKYDLFKNAFLMKDLTWGYEEEVRVVKKSKETKALDTQPQPALLKMKQENGTK